MLKPPKLFVSLDWFSVNGVLNQNQKLERQQVIGFKSLFKEKTMHAYQYTKNMVLLDHFAKEGLSVKLSEAPESLSNRIKSTVFKETLSNVITDSTDFYEKTEIIHDKEISNCKFIYAFILYYSQFNIFLFPKSINISKPYSHKQYFNYQNKKTHNQNHSGEFNPRVFFRFKDGRDPSQIFR